MSLRLTVKQRSEQGGVEKATVVLLENDEVTLGRDPTCQVVLAQQAVSRAHAKISRDGTLFFVEDLGSSYGTQINGKKLPKGEKRLLQNGDVIAIAQFDVQFDRVAQQAAPEGAGATQFVARRVLKDVMQGLGTDGAKPYFRIMNGPREGEHITLSDAQEVVIGREEGADILFKDDLTSRKHMKIRRDWSGTHVEDLGSRNGIKVNRKRAQKRTLKDRDEVEVGATRLLYIDPSDVREAPLVLPEAVHERTVAVEESTVAVEQEPVAQVPAPAPEAPPEPEPPADPDPVPSGEALEPPPDLPPELPEPGELGEPPLGTDVDHPSVGGGGLFANRQNLVIMGVAGFVSVLAIVAIVLLLAGA